jgi:hypothetical protein
MKELDEIPMPCSKCPLLQQKLEQVERSLRKKSRNRKASRKGDTQVREAMEYILDFAGVGN